MAKKREVNWCPAEVSSDHDLTALIGGLEALFQVTKSSEDLWSDPFFGEVHRETGYHPIQDGEFESLCREWEDKGKITMTEENKAFFLKPPQRDGEGNEQNLIVRLTMLYDPELGKCYIGMEIFTPVEENPGWAVLPLHFDNANEETEGRVSWRFYHLQSARRGGHLAPSVLEQAERLGHDRLPRIPLAADCVTDLFRCAVLSLFGNGPVYSELSRTLRDRRAPVICNHLKRIASG